MRIESKSATILMGNLHRVCLMRGVAAMVVFGSLSCGMGASASELSGLRGAVAPEPALRKSVTINPLIAVPLRTNGYSHSATVAASPTGDPQYENSPRPPVAETYVEDVYTDPLTEDRSFFSFGDIGTGLRSTAGYLMTRTIDTLFFRGTHEAVKDRNVVYNLPDRGPLRKSMTHSVNYDSGLRGGDVTVAESVSTALRGSYSTKEKLERANAEQARLHGAMAMFLPKVTGTIEAETAGRNSLSAGSYQQDLITASVEVSIPIFTSGVNTNTFRQAKHVSKAADYSYLAEERRAALEAVQAHINLRLNRRIERALKSNVNAMQKVQMIAQKLYEAGDASRTDVAIAQANVESARSELDIARRTREETRADYESVTGRTAPAGLSLKAPEGLLPNSLEAAVQSALSNNPTLLSAQHTAKAEEHQAKIAKGRFGPQVDAYGRYDSYLHDSLQEDRKPDYTIGVRLRVPLVDFGAVPAIDAARHTAAQAGYNALEQGRLLRRQVERQWSAYHSAARRVKIVQRQVNAVARSVEGARKEYEAGFRSITDVLGDQVKLARARIALESAKHEKLLAAYELAFSTSQENVQHIALAN